MDNCDEETECLRRVVCVCICVYACLHVDFLLFFPPMQIFVNVYFYLHTDSFLSNSVPLFVQGWAQRPSGGSGKVGPGGTAGAILKATKPQMLVRFGAWWFAESSDVRKQSGQRLWEAKSTEKNRKKNRKKHHKKYNGLFFDFDNFGKIIHNFFNFKIFGKKSQLKFKNMVQMDFWWCVFFLENMENLFGSTASQVTLFTQNH